MSGTPDVLGRAPPAVIGLGDASIGLVSYTGSSAEVVSSMSGSGLSMHTSTFVSPPDGFGGGGMGEHGIVLPGLLLLHDIADTGLSADNPLPAITSTSVTPDDVGMGEMALREVLLPGLWLLEDAAVPGLLQITDDGLSVVVGIPLTGSGDPEITSTSVRPEEVGMGETALREVPLLGLWLLEDRADPGLLAGAGDVGLSAGTTLSGFLLTGAFPLVFPFVFFLGGSLVCLNTSTAVISAGDASLGSSAGWG